MPSKALASGRDGAPVRKNLADVTREQLERTRDLMTPAVVHYGHAPRLLDHRREVLTEAFRRHPERFVHGAPEPPSMPEAVWINPPSEKKTLQDAPGATIWTPDDLQHTPDFSSYELSAGPAVLAGLEVRQ